MAFMRIQLSLAVFIFGILHLSGQDFKTYLKENALKFEKADSLNNEIYNALSDYSLIMIGEMHGTNEPADFVRGLTNLFTGKGDSVSVGFEIPAGQMEAYLANPEGSNIIKSEFFQNTPDGRNSSAWVSAIAMIGKNPLAHIFFYDTDKKYSNSRDSEMYVNIKREILQHPGWKTFTLSGNVHNMLLPHRGEIKTAYYLQHDNDLELIDKMCSLNHVYQTGSMFNMMNDTLKKRDVNYPPSEYSSVTGYENYLFLFPVNVADNYSGVFFTRRITASEAVSIK